MIRRLLVLLALLLSVAAGASVVQNPDTRVELIAGLATPGGGRTLGIVLTPKPGWHSYWSNPGEAGFAPKPVWTLPPGVTATPLRFRGHRSRRCKRGNRAAAQPGRGR